MGDPRIRGTAGHGRALFGRSILGPDFAPILETVLGPRLPRIPTYYPGQPVEPLTIQVEPLRALLVAELAAAGDAVVWVDAEGAELLVLAAEARVAVLTAAVAVGLPVRCDDAPPGDLTAVLTIGENPALPVPLVLVDPRPVGDVALAARWGPSVTATVLAAFLATLHRVCAATGTGPAGEPLVPAAVWVRDGAVVVRPRTPFPGEAGQG